MTFRSGFVCILGRPNAGKSTLLNALAGEKLAIVSPKPQTTRNRVLGVIHLRKAKGKSGAQVVLIDTPGVHPPDSSLGKKMMSEVREALSGCDLVLLIMDSTRRNEASDQLLFRLLEKSHTPIFLLLNKIDKLEDKSSLLPLIDWYRNEYEWREIIPISALKDEMTDVLIASSLRHLPEGEPIFSEDELTDQTLRSMVYLKLGQGAQAAAEARKVLDQRGQGPLSSLWPLAHLALARASAMQGDTAQARKSYQDFFTLWKDADPDLPILIAANPTVGRCRSTKHVTNSATRGALVCMGQTLSSLN